ncbi:MAG: ATPase, T2SS/T4P/T4SS family [Patescibacteria group bacterium]|jgi:type IV pilus assembly protein PilB
MSVYSVNKFLDYFAQNKLIDPKTLETIQMDILKSDISAEEYLRKKRLASESELMNAKAFALGVEFIDLQSTAASPEALNLVPELISREFDIFPFEYDQKNELVRIASEDPLNLETISFLEKKTGKKVLPYLATKTDIDDAIRLQYRQNISPTVVNALQENTPKDKDKQFEVQRNKDQTVVKEPPIARLVNTILEYAVKGRASDIHIEPQELKTRVRYRIDGILYEKLSLPKSLQDSLISRIKILSEMRIDERRIPQDGRFTFKIGDQEVDLRVSSLPTVHGEKIVMRLLKKTGGIPSLPDLGLGNVTLQNLEAAITKPYGIVLITGPTGSGKTTTLYSILSRLNKPSVNIMTLEDPVEYEIPGLNQVQIHPQAGLTFATGLRSFLRQDPNIILVGEIRDKETTALAIQAALTGHLVFSTLHTNDAATAIPRLIDLGAEPFLIASVLAAVAGQRILRRICQNCKMKYNPTPEIEQAIRKTLGELVPADFKDKPLELYKGKGCDECGSSGYFGRIGIYELIPVNSQISHLILKSATAGEIETEARKYGLITMKQDGFLKALSGMTTIEEVMRVAEE